ncbi:hypothetical protein HF086_010992 [Spodoptera exigua]|uniref:Peptidase aspartic putative domain-containing protein n=1 Tax=Spodoptera exigua TaxID=7107 RepID=A0A922MDZ3_SPOEX|nr:hypothetical protein HF086_010992 [Spodoptera exigua]
MTTESDKVSMKFRELSLKRSSIKGQIKKFKNYLSSLELVQLSSIQIVELSLKLSKFEGLSSKFDDLQTEIEVLNHKNLDSELDERDSIEQDIILCIATAKNVIEDANNQEPYTDHVFLSTVVIEVSNPLTSATEKVRALLDCGSQSSLITKALKQKLQLDTNKTNEINIIGIGNNLCHKNDFYVDDLITGSNNEEELHHIKESVSKALSSACFPLRKYKSNLTSILHDKIGTIQDIQESWDVFVNNLHYLATLQIPRYVICDNARIIEIQAFSDASQCAYGACVYVKSINQNNEVSIKLLCAKSKVASLKPVTIPRLELCAALLVARLTRAVCSAVRHQYSRVVHWCDSSVVIAWIHSVPRNLKTFVANRIREIVEITQPSSWRYVPTSENPADHISRGVNPSQLGTLSLWWNGPSFLYLDESGWPTLNLNMANKENLPEVKTNLHTTIEQLINFENYSSFTKLQRVIAFVKRFINNSKNPHIKRTGFLRKN